MDLSDINLLDLDRFAEGPPHDWFAYLRAHAPVYLHPDRSERGFWAVTKFDDIKTVASTPEVFSSSYLRGGTVVLGHGGIDTTYQTAPKAMNTLDAPEHLKYRRLTTRAFSARSVDALAPAIRKAAATLIDEALTKDVVDFANDIAAKIPVQAIGELLGIPPEDRYLLEEWTNTLMGSEDPELASSPDEVAQASAQMFAYGNKLKDLRRAEPKDDLMSRLLAAEVDGERLTDEEIAGFFALLVIAGSETSRNVMAHGLIGVLQDPDTYPQLVADPGLARAATEEILRWSPAVYYLGRHATQDFVLNGQEIKAGDRVAMFFASGNRDEDKFDDPDRFDIHRNPKEHLAFGAGPHSCLGSHLARLEITVVFEELAQRVRSVRLVDKPRYLRSNLAGGVKHLPVSFVAA